MPDAEGVVPVAELAAAEAADDEESPSEPQAPEEETQDHSRAGKDDGSYGDVRQTDRSHSGPLDLIDESVRR